MRLPYEVIVMQADRLIIKMVLSSNPTYYWDQYILLLEACGWTDLEFDMETLRRIDRNWRPLWN